MPDFTSFFTQERDHWQQRAETAETQLAQAKATISEMLDENNRLDADRDSALAESARLRDAFAALSLDLLQHTATTPDDDDHEIICEVETTIAELIAAVLRGGQ